MTRNYYFLKKLFSLILVSASAFVLYGQTEISNRAGLEAINNNLGGSYVLTADIDLTGTDWSPLGTEGAPFTGTLDGDGHIITGLRYDNTDSDNSDYPSGSRKVGLFSVISGGTVKNLGLERAYVKGGKHVGGIAGTLKGGAVVEQCYVGNSYIETGDHGGSIAGQMDGPATIRNCYANGEVYSRADQGSGLLGRFVDQGLISKCYFSGIVRSGRPSGIGAYRDEGTPKVENSVSLAPYILGTSNLRVVPNDNSTKSKLYSLKYTFLDGNKDNFSTTSIVPTNDGNYGTDKRHGANIPGGDAQSLSQSFYQHTLSWDFDDVWKMPANGYPILKWQSDPTEVSVVAIKGGDKLLFPGKPLNLYKYIHLGNTLQSNTNVFVDFTSASSYVEVVNGAAQLTASGLTQTGTIDVTINIVAKSGYTLTGSKTSFTIKIKPEISEISTPAQLMDMTDFQKAYKLTADLDFDGITFTRLNEFKGVLDGNGHVIKNLTYNNTEDGDDKGNTVGLFKTIKDAKIYNLGLENINFIGRNDVAALAGKAIGQSEIENCYVANSYLEGRDHVASIAGALQEGATIRNCYSNARVHSREHQAGGLSGVIGYGFIYNSYYSGMVSNVNNRAVGIGGYQDDASQNPENVRIENCVSLSPYMLSNNWNADAVRILHDAGGRPATLVNNYGLDTAWRGKNDWSGGGLVSEDTGKIGTDKLQGANVSNADARTQAFYEKTLHWDFNHVWKMSDGGFPILQWQTAPLVADFIALKDEYVIEKDNTSGINLAYTLPNTYGILYTLVSDDETKLTVNGNVIKVADSWNEMLATSVDVRLTSAATGISLKNSDPLNFGIVPSAIYSDASLSALSVTGFDLIPAFDAHVYNYDVYVDESIENAVIAATTTQSGAVITDAVNLLGTQELNIGQNVFTLEVNSQNEENSKTYTLTIHRGLFSVSKLDGTGKRQVNVYSSDSNNGKESAYRLLIGKHAVSSNDDKWCPSDGNITTPQATFTFAEIYEVSAVAWRDKHFRESGDGQIDTWKVEVSLDADSWTEVINVSGQADLVNKYETFTPVEARYLRFTPTKNGQGAAWIYGFDIYGAFAESVNEHVLSRGKTILEHSGYYQGYGRETPANILDGQYETTPWATYDSNPYAIIDLEKVQSIGGFKLVVQQDNKEVEPDFITGFNVYTKETQEEEWGSPLTGSISTATGTQVGEIKLSSLLTARYVKLAVADDQKPRPNAWLRIKEFEVYDNSLLTKLETPQAASIPAVRIFQESTQRIAIVIQGDVQGSVRVVNLLGHEVYAGSLTGNKTTIHPTFNPGIYVVSIQNKGKTMTQKVVVK